MNRNLAPFVGKFARISLAETPAIKRMNCFVIELNEHSAKIKFKYFLFGFILLTKTVESRDIAHIEEISPARMLGIL